MHARGIGLTVVVGAAVIASTTVAGPRVPAPPVVEANARVASASSDPHEDGFCVSVSAGDDCSPESLMEKSGVPSTAGSLGYWVVTDVRPLTPGPGLKYDATWAGPLPVMAQDCPYETRDSSGAGVWFGYVRVGPSGPVVEDEEVAWDGWGGLQRTSTSAWVDCTRRY